MAHYAGPPGRRRGPTPPSSALRAERQTAATLRFVPRTWRSSAAEGLILAGLLAGFAPRRDRHSVVSVGVLGLTLVEMLWFGFGLNPAIDRASDRPMTALIADLRARGGRSGRIIGLGAEFPPNALMRYGLLDARNYDSVETAAEPRLAPAAL